MNTLVKTKENFPSINIFTKLILSISCCFAYVENGQAQKRDSLVVEYLKKNKEFAFERNRDSATFYLQKAEQQALGSSEELFRVYSRCAAYFFKEEIKLDSARVYLNKMQELLPDIQNRVLRARAYNKTGYFYQLDGKIAESFQSYQKALEINSADHPFVHANVLARSYIRMARLYGKVALYENALDYAKKAMDLIENG
jgi:tetratricopeptide (TPR) repeat protein